MKLWLRRVGNALYASNDEAVEIMGRIPANKPLFGDVRVPRSKSFDGLFWTMCARIGEGIGKEADWVKEALMIETGRVHEYTTRTGKVVLIVDSMSHQAMDAVAFKRFFEECLEVIYGKWQIDPKVFADLFKEIGDGHS